ncbi:LysR substrate-binding domain-containing protein [Marinomonas aquiplantarum]|uniref:LysR substrate-binding domain-containing protein n=1 Tax=Marinomonas aquiplantarum TaxID=491951 RepID=UPI003CCC4C75
MAGHGIAVLSDFMTHQARASGTLIEVLPNTLTTPNDREMIHAVYYRHSALSARISAFIEYIAPRLKL